MIARMAALTVPSLAGAAWMAIAGFPHDRIAIQCVALLVGALLIAAGSRFDIPPKPLGVVLVVLLYLPLLLGPEVGGEQRWIGAGPVILTTGLLCVPALSVLLSRARRSWFVAPLALIFIAGLFQSDPSIAMALAFVILVLGGTNLVAIAAGLLLLCIGSILAIRDTMEPVPFVEGVLADAASSQPVIAALLAFALAGCIILILRIGNAPTMQKRALAACMFGFVCASLIGPFPVPLIGYGAAPILGLSLALAILKPENDGGQAA
uniref:hypothetical protein n=1 Tax=Parerythrobacter lutipelagi TaxID=1964208 RepID=UPI0010F6DDA5|nr:hypothetical protein [Parerythrobacter lutipelagi]